MRSSTTQQWSPPPWRWRRRVAIGSFAIASALSSAVAAAAPPPPPVPPAPPAPLAPPPLSTVLQQVVQGDLLLTGSSSRPGPDGAEVSDVDGDSTVRCISRSRWWGSVCQDNSSSARVDLPYGAEVIAARLYVTTSVEPTLGPLRVGLAGPGDDGRHSTLGTGSAGVPHLGEQGAGAHRQAVWDVTEFVRDRGAGDYTVADIVVDTTDGAAAYSAWSVVVAYQLVEGVDVATLPPELQTRFARRALSWHDGLAIANAGRQVDIEVGGFTVPIDRAVFARSLHVATPIAVGFDNLLFDGQPLGNNATPGDSVAPAGLTIGVDPACNSTVDLVNGSICTMGTSAVRPAAEPAPSDPPPPVTAPVSVVDMDVVRIPDRYLRPGATTAAVSFVADQDVAVGVLAVSVDQPIVPPADPAAVQR